MARERNPPPCVAGACRGTAIVRKGPVGFESARRAVRVGDRRLRPGCGRLGQSSAGRFDWTKGKRAAASGPDERNAARQARVDRICLVRARPAEQRAGKRQRHRSVAATGGRWSAEGSRTQLAWSAPAAGASRSSFEARILIVASIGVGGAPRASPRVGSMVDLRKLDQGAARSPFPLCTWKSGVSTSARPGVLRLHIYDDRAETAFRCGTAIAPDGFEPSTSRL
jgi:hypothetical protein